MFQNFIFFIFYLLMGFFIFLFKFVSEKQIISLFRALVFKLVQGYQRSKLTPWAKGAFLP